MNADGKKLGRRNLLKAGVGLVAAGAVGVPALVFQSQGGSKPSAAAAEPTSLDSTGPIVVFVQDAARGEVVIMQGLEQTVVTDFDLVSRIVGAGRI